MPPFSDADRRFMARAVELARRGEGRVEPNPMVGCVIVRGAQVVGEGWHDAFGGPHAEVAALRAAGPAAQGATVYVTLEPCTHHGKTPPCTDALVAAGVARVVVAVGDPNSAVPGGGLERLRLAGVQCAAGLASDDASDLIAPFAKLATTGRPWIIAKWAMTLDGQLAAVTGSSKWISGAESRALGHALRGRVDAVLVGRETAELDDPLLTARPAGPRVAVRVVADSHARLAPTSRLAATAREFPTLVAASAAAPSANCAALRRLGVEVWQSPGETLAARLGELLDELGRRQLTNVLAEGGGRLLGQLFALGEIDEVHAVVAPRLLGGGRAWQAPPGAGVARMADALQLRRVQVRSVGDDVHISGRTK